MVFTYEVYKGMGTHVYLVLTTGHLVIFVREIGGLIFLFLTEMLTISTKTPVKDAEREVYIMQMGQNH